MALLSKRFPDRYDRRSRSPLGVLWDEHLARYFHPAGRATLVRNFGASPGFSSFDSEAAGVRAEIANPARLPVRCGLCAARGYISNWLHHLN